MSRARLILTGAALVLLGPPLAIGAAALSGVGHRWVDILAQFVGPALFTVGLIAIAVVGFRLWVAAAATGLTLLVLAVAGWPQWFPPTGTAAVGAPEFSLYSANVWVGNTDVGGMARSIEAAGADIVVLVEVGDTPAGQMDRIVGAYPYRVTGNRNPGKKGPSRYVFASRWPLRTVQVHAEELDAHGLVAETPLGPVTLVGVHLTRPWPYQYQWGQIIQARGLANWRKAYSGPMIFAGDFNSVSSARIGRQIQAETGLIPAPGWPGTWHSAMPSPAAMTIDQVYRSPDLALLDRRLGRGNGSDHRPVITRFTRAAPPPAG
ncbi:endonuclease/exonuclease/phosphatase family protein [Brevundimonas subvibrioides]|uniref:Endonuclease/exonuclease/phosphatase n=1 Tax=Brevundimonas subvibrioides (strain ATCC 15264 / DSM 4735 / LMG 14903 / NBRC 16000 / CB 81) TaxID=633149 RepID=D9QM28_BRESC|nr:endonuclease/exonuclease/phosphatase family protein [Brevundimonas subvibrioides]ADL01954.1 Endonuclease/exonuclease/phosphatase [Brevundimonas subvibrioides ATCC 15264]